MTPRERAEALVDALMGFSPIKQVKLAELAFAEHVRVSSPIRLTDIERALNYLDSINTGTLNPEQHAAMWFAEARAEGAAEAKEHVRALLADEATIEVVANAIARMDEEMRTGGDERSGYRFLAEAALTALRGKAFAQ
jgi:hypothetical protein